VADVAAGVRSDAAGNDNRFKPIRDALRALGHPRTPAERDALGEIQLLVLELLGEMEDVKR
jgi:hypothetical protein